MKDIVIIGSGGFGAEVAMLIEDINKEKLTWNLKGFVDDNPNMLGKRIYNYKVIGDIDWLKSQEMYTVIAIGDGKVRENIYQRIKSTKNKFATLIHPNVLYSDAVKIGEGSIICAGNIITTNISIGKQVIINLSSTIGHDAVLDDYVTILPGAHVSGHVQLEKYVTIGTGTQIIQGLTVGKGTIVGAGATVVKELPENCTAVGSPAKPIKYHE